MENPSLKALPKVNAGSSSSNSAGSNAWGSGVVTSSQTEAATQNASQDVRSWETWENGTAIIPQSQALSPINAWASHNGVSTSRTLFRRATKPVAVVPIPSVQPAQSQQEVVNSEKSWDCIQECTPDGRLVPQKSAEEKHRDAVTKRAFRANALWPNIPDMKTLAPFLESGIPWDMAINPQENCIILTSGIFENPIISGKIFGFLGQDHLAVSALTRSCQRFAQLYQDEVEHWDITHGYFSNCDVTRPTVDELRKDEKAFRNQASVKSRVVVTQIRGEAISYEKQVTNIYRLGLAIRNFGRHFQNLSLHRVPFLTVDILDIMVPYLENLKFLGIYACPLIHIGDLPRLLKLLTTDRLKGREDRVNFDFRPQYHTGPGLHPRDRFSFENWDEINKYETKHGTGSYGVTWDNSGLDTNVGTWAIVLPGREKARKLGIDLTRPGSVFRQWLDESPCGFHTNVSKVLGLHDQCLDAKDRQVRIAKMTELAVNINFPVFKGSIRKEIVGNWAYAGYPACTAWMSYTWFCAGCRNHQLAMLYSREMIARIHIRNTAQPPPCLGCKLTEYLNSEIDHYKSSKRIIIRRWLETSNPDAPMNKDDLEKFISDFEARGMAARGAKLDMFRSWDIEGRDGYWDRELDERQNPKTDSHLRDQTRNSSPKVWVDVGGWNALHGTRMMGHHF